MNEEQFAQWCILELLGHRRMAGFVQEQTIAGAALIRIDVPASEDQPAFTQFYGAAAIYAMTPTTEEIARAVAARQSVAPVQRFELKALTAPIGKGRRDDDELDDPFTPTHDDKPWQDDDEIDLIEDED